MVLQERVSGYLKTEFPNRWISRRVALEWSTISLDLSPINFFLMGSFQKQYLSNRTCKHKDMTDRTTANMRVIIPQKYEMSQMNFIIGYCQEVEAHFEHLIN